MCDPVSMSITMVALSAASAYVQHEGQVDYAEGMGQYQNELAIQTNKNANEALTNEYAQISQNEMKTDAKVSQEAIRNAVLGAKSRGSAITYAGEAGINGLSVDSLLGDFYRQEASYLDAIKYNAHMERGDNMWRKKGARSTAQSRINGSRPQPINAPSALGGALQIGTAGAQGYYMVNGVK